MYALHFESSIHNIYEEKEIIVLRRTGILTTFALC